MTPERMAEALFDRLAAYKTVPGTKEGRVGLQRMLTPTAAELELDAFMAEAKARVPKRREPMPGHPGTAKLVAQFKAARAALDGKAA